VTDSDEGGGWTLLTAHGHVLVEIARNPETRIRDISGAVGITERTTAAIVSDLEEAGYITRTRVGRRNRYTVHLDAPFRHPAQAELPVRPLLEFLAKLSPDGRTTPTEQDGERQCESNSRH
jgi:DNA-binding MarR family transcriptional regulator